MTLAKNADPETTPPGTRSSVKAAARLASETDAVWRIAPVVKSQVEALAEELGIPISIATIYVLRGLTTRAEAEHYCDLTPDKMHDPMTLPDIMPVLDRLEKALANKEHIHIHGDYDADGVTSTSVVVYTLRRMGANFTYHVPHRIEEGYDVRVATVEYAHSIGAKVLMTVDCGVLAFEAAERAKELGIDLIITDHHNPHKDGLLPDCIGVVNPNRADSQYPFSGLAGVGIAFKVMSGLAMRRGVSMEAVASKVMDWVALGTVADVAPMEDENRYLVARGCEMLAASEKVGIKELLKAAGVKDKVSTMNIGFGLGPRINAVGRLGAAETALELMLEEVPSRANALAKQLNVFNDRRQDLQKQWVAEAKAMLPEDMAGTYFIVLGSASWHPGLVGLMAGDLAKAYGRPALVCTLKEDGSARGSCRSYGDFHILNALKSPECVDLFTRCGGHAFAAGFDLPQKNLPLLRQRLNDYWVRINGEGEQIKVLEVDARMYSSEINTRTLDAIAKLAPFGQGNREPLFVCRGLVVKECETMSEGLHLRLLLSGRAKDDWGIKAKWWRHGSRADAFPVGTVVDAVYTLGMNTFAGRTNLEITLEDMRPSELFK